MRRLATLSFVSVILTASVAFGMKAKDVYKKSGPAVVLILGSDDGKSGSGGTGSIVTADGRVVTNAHVVINDRGQAYKTLYVFLKPPKLTGDNKRDLVNRYKARVVAFSPAAKLDLAVLQIQDPPPNLPTIKFANPDDVEIGDEVVAIGHPESGGLWTLTTGTVSTLIANFNRVQGKHVFQTEASVNRGNSGGPLLDDEGNMIGINTSIARQGAGGVAITDVNFSLKSSVAVKWMAGAVGMGLAYAPTKSEEMVLAVAPEPARPAQAQAQAVSTAPEKPAVVAKPKMVREPPRATIVVVEAPPKKPAQIKEEGRTLGNAKAKEKVEAGKRLDVKKAKPKVLTRKRPFSLDELRRQQMKELEDIMDEARGKVRKKKSQGMGLW